MLHTRTASSLNGTLRISLLFITLTACLVACSQQSTTGVRQPTMVPTGTTVPPTATPAGPLAQTWQHQSPDTVSAAIDAYIAKMSLDDRIGQTFIVQYQTDTYTDDAVTFIRKFHPAGVILYAWLMNDAGTVRKMIADSQADSPIPLLIQTDMEGGQYNTLRNLDKTYRPTPPDIVASGSTSYAFDQGKKTAQDLLALGINMNLAPDVDVMTYPGPDQGGRTFGTTPAPVITYGGAYLDGLQTNGVIGTLKHYPGLGGSTVDAHKDLPVINRSKDQIYSVDLAPYRALVNAANPPAAIMSTDLLMPAIDGTYPAELSKAFITDILRNQLHYNGVVMTDALYMDGIKKTWALPEATVLAMIAGCDLTLGIWTSGQAAQIVAAIKDAINTGRLTEQQLNASVKRILMMKAEYLGWKPPSN